MITAVQCHGLRPPGQSVDFIQAWLTSILPQAWSSDKLAWTPILLDKLYTNGIETVNTDGFQATKNGWLMFFPAIALIDGSWPRADAEHVRAAIHTLADWTG